MDFSDRRLTSEALRIICQSQAPRWPGEPSNEFREFG